MTSATSGPSIATTHSASAASAAASAVGYSPTTSSAPGGPGHFSYQYQYQFPPAFAAKPPPPYSASTEYDDAPDVGAGAGYKGKGKANVNGDEHVQGMASIDSKGHKGGKDGYANMGLGYEGTVPLNDTYVYRRDMKIPLVNADAEHGSITPDLASVQYRDVYASKHKRAASDAAGTTYSCPAGLFAHQRFGAGLDGEGETDANDGRGGFAHRPDDSFPYNGPSQTSHVEVDVTDSASNAPFLSTDNGAYTPRSPYRPGEYSYTSLRRSTRGGVSYTERTSSRVERHLFSRDRDPRDGHVNEGRGNERGQEEDMDVEQEQEVPKRNRGSSPLQPPFEARLFLRAGASVDVISWLRKNFHYIPSAAHSVLTPSTSLLAIRALIAERFPRLPEPEELIKAVTVAFPRSSWDYPANASEPPMIRGLVWNGKELEVYDEDEDGEEVESDRVRTPEGKGKEREREKDKATWKDKGKSRNGQGQGAEAQYWRDHHKQMKNKRTVEAAAASARASASANGHAQVHGRAPDAPLTRGAARSSLAAGNTLALNDHASPPRTAYGSPSSSSRSHVQRNAPATPARSVLDDFAELATLADKTPNSKAQSLPGDGGVFGRGMMGVSASAPGMAMRNNVANGSGGAVPPAPAFALASICNSFDGGAMQGGADEFGFGGAIGALAGGRAGDGAAGAIGGGGSRGRKRKSTGQYSTRRGDRDASPDRLSDLLAAAQAVDEDEVHMRSADASTAGGAPSGTGGKYGASPGAGAGYMMRRNSSSHGSASSGHKRRRTIGGMGPGMREMIELNLDAQHPPPAWAHRPYGALFGQAVPMSRSGSGVGGVSGQYAPTGQLGWGQGQGQGRWSAASAQNGDGGVGGIADSGSRSTSGSNSGSRATGSAWTRQLASLPEMATPKKEKADTGAYASANGLIGAEGSAGGGGSDVDELVVKRQFAADAAALSMSASASASTATSASASGATSASASQASLAVPTLGKVTAGGQSVGTGKGKEKGGRKKAAAAAAGAANSGAGQATLQAGLLADSTTVSQPFDASVIDPTLTAQTLHSSHLASTSTSSYPPTATATVTVTAAAAAGSTGGTAAPPRRSRKANELPTEGEAPGIDCKPPYPYHEMIRYAIQQAPDCRLQLSQIYSNIADRFPFFKTLDEKKTAGWQNSIRHNLSLKKMFVRVSKEDGVPDEGGKGGWWTVKMGVPDEGRPGRKGKGKRKSDADSEVGSGTGAMQDEGVSGGYAQAAYTGQMEVGAANADAQAELRAGLGKGRVTDGQDVAVGQLQVDALGSRAGQ